MRVRFRHLEQLTAGLAAALTLDDVARVVLTQLLGVEDVLRVGIAVSQGAGRELRFLSSDEESFGPHWMRWCNIDGLAGVPLARTVRTGEPVHLADEAEMEAEFPELARRLQLQGTRALASVPLNVDSGCLGGLLVCWARPQPLTTELGGFLAAFAAHVAHAMRRGMAYHVQRTLPEELQRSFLPHSLPDVEGLELAAHHRAGGRHVAVGGDWYDVMPLPDGRVSVTLGDVRGKGIEAAVVMSELRTAVRAYALEDPDPSRVLARLDLLMSHTSLAEQVVTMAYGVVDRGARKLALALAGHPPPLLVPPSGPPRLEGPWGPALGIASGPWPSLDVDLETGSTLLLYSDGLVESRQRDLFAGMELLRDAVVGLEGRRRNARELCTRVVDAVVSDDVDDDVTLLALTAAPPRKTASRTFQAAPAAAREARVRTTDAAATEEVSGRGLSLVQTLSSAWNVEQSTDGTLVWCELELDPAPVDAFADLGRDSMVS